MCPLRLVWKYVSRSKKNCRWEQVSLPKKNKEPWRKKFLKIALIECAIETALEMRLCKPRTTYQKIKKIVEEENFWAKKPNTLNSEKLPYYFSYSTIFFICYSGCSKSHFKTGLNRHTLLGHFWRIFCCCYRRLFSFGPKSFFIYNFFICRYVVRDVQRCILRLTSMRILYQDEWDYMFCVRVRSNYFGTSWNNNY